MANPQFSSIIEGLEFLLDNYKDMDDQSDRARYEARNKTIHHALSQIRELIRGALIKAYSGKEIRVRSAKIFGRWPTVPWFAFGPSDGEVVYEGEHFVLPINIQVNVGKDGVYLTLLVAADQWKDAFPYEWVNKLQDAKVAIRQEIWWLKAEGFVLEDDLDESIKGKSGYDMQRGYIAHKFYRRGEIPSDADLLKDIDLLDKANQQINGMNFSPGMRINYWVVDPSDGSGVPGKELGEWGEWQRSGLNTVGFKELADRYERKVVGCDDKKKFLKAYTAIYGADGRAEAAWTLLQEIEKGDIVLVRNGVDSIVAQGKVDSNLTLNGGSERPFERLVKWNVLTPEKKIPKDLKQRVSGLVAKLTKEEYDRLMGNHPSGPQGSATPSGRISQLLLKKQVILYGPPGTGKTYSTRSLALELIGNV